MLRRFDLDKLLAESDTDYLFVTSTPPLLALPGEVYKYELAVKSRRGGVKTKLESGPEGMKLSAEGKLTWSVPKVPAGQSVDVIVGVADSTEQEIFQSFQIQVGNQRGRRQYGDSWQIGNHSDKTPAAGRAWRNQRPGPKISNWFPLASFVSPVRRLR